MNIDTILDTANDLLDHALPAVKGTAKDALHSVEKTAKSGAKTLGHGIDDVTASADHARQEVVSQANHAGRAMRSRVLRTYDLAVKLAPFLLPERAVKVRNRRIAYAAVGGLVLGAVGIAAWEMAKPGTLAGIGRRVTGMFKSDEAAAAKPVDPEMDHKGANNKTGAAAAETPASIPDHKMS